MNPVAVREKRVKSELPRDVREASTPRGYDIHEAHERTLGMIGMQQRHVAATSRIFLERRPASIELSFSEGNIAARTGTFGDDHGDKIGTSFAESQNLPPLEGGLYNSGLGAPRTGELLPGVLNQKPSRGSLEQPSCGSSSYNGWKCHD